MYAIRSYYACSRPHRKRLRLHPSAALHLSELAKSLELLGRSGTTDGADTLWAEADAEFGRVRAALEALV